MSNVNEIKSKDVKITLLDGVERKLLFTLNALAELEDKYGSVQAAFDKLSENSMKAVRCVLWAGLLHTQENLTEQQVGNLIDVQSMEQIIGSLGTAFDNDMPTKEESTQNPNQ